MSNIMAASLQDQIEADASVLLCRAFLHKRVCAFGDDGLGQFGRHSLAQHYTVEDIDVTVELNEETGDAIGVVSFKLTGYDSSLFGHIMTDQNFLIRCRELLTADHMDPKCLSYAILEMQGDDFVSMDIDVPLLLDWA